MIRTLLLTTACLASYAVAHSPRVHVSPRGEDITAYLKTTLVPAPVVAHGESTRRKSLTGGNLSMTVRTLVGEAARQSDVEATAIAHVIFNRLESKRWGKSVASVVLHQEQRPSGRWTYAFTCFDPIYGSMRNVWGRDIEKTRAWARMTRIAQAAWLDRDNDPTRGALQYFHPKAMGVSGSTPSWARGKPKLKIGDAVFIPNDGGKS